MKRFAHLITSYPRWVLSGLFLLTLYFGYGLTKLEVRNSDEAELPKDDPIIATNDRFSDIFGEKDMILIGIESENIFNKGTLQKIIDISEELKKVELVYEDEITSLATANNIKGREWGLEVGPFMEEVPQTAEAMAQLKRDIRSNKLIYGRLVSTDETSTIIFANIAKDYDQARVYDQVQDIIARYQGPEKIYATGDPIMSQEIDLGIQHDVELLLPIAMLLVLFGFFISFRSLRGVFIPFSVVVLAIIWTMGLMGHIGLPMTVVSSALPMLLVAVSSSYGIHVVHRYYEEVAENDALTGTRLATEKITPAILLTGITSALGSATLIIFKVTSIREFGIITALGILATLFITLTFIPAVLSLLKKAEKSPRTANSPRFDRFLISAADFSVNKRGLVLGISLLLVLVAMIGISKVRVGTDFVGMFPPEHSIHETFEFFNSKLGGGRYMNVMIEGGEVDEAKDPDLLRRVAAFQEYAESLPGVGYTSSFADILKRMNLVMNEGKAEFDRIPESRELVAQYLLLYSMSADPGDFENLVDYDYQRAKIRVNITTSEQEDHKRLHRQFQSYLQNELKPEMKSDFGGMLMVWLAQIRYIAIGKIQNIIMAVLLVFLFCTLIYRSFAGGLLAITPLVIATLLTFGLMGFLGIRLDMGTAIITAIAVGIGVDFAIHYIARFREELAGSGNLEQATRTTMLTTGRAIIYDVMSNVLGFMVFIFSGFQPIQYFGWLISLTMITVCLGTLMMMPALFSVFKPKFARSRAMVFKSEKATEAVGVGC